MFPSPAQFGTMLYALEKTPESKKGYGLSARTAARFPSCNKVHDTHLPLMSNLLCQLWIILYNSGTSHTLTAGV